MEYTLQEVQGGELMMSGKRFTYFETDLFEGILDNGNLISTKEAIDLLNSLVEENEKLRKELSECEKFRYSVFKRIEKTIEDKDNCAINKDAKYPCKAYDECLKRKGTNKPLPCMVNWVMGRPFENMLRKELEDE